MAAPIDIITRALRKVGALAKGQDADGTDVLDAMEYFNDLLEQWATEDLMLYYSDIISHALTSGLFSYTIGPDVVAPNITTQRPIEILSAWIRTADNLDIPIRVVSFNTYQNQIQKETQPTYPSMVAYQPTVPAGYIYLWQTPTSGLTLRLEVNNQFSTITEETLHTEINLPNGYRKALVDCLAKELLPEYGRTEGSEDIKTDAITSKMLIKRKNVKKNLMSLDRSFLPRKIGTYNPYSDQ